ncbi:hypothetical protein [Tomitella biformata]|uniref:hypothetical protein n=1 Tax=Tomitella biformata TaxID=630403 RepID=UPI000463447C|nr:hypothetical protein [Tomitella biformata]
MRSALVAVAALTAVSLSGCATVLTGVPSPTPGGPVPAAVDTSDLGALLIGPADFPEGYSVQVLEYRDAVLASGDLSGVSREARSNPVRCQPSATPPGEQDLAMVSGMGAVDQSTLAVVLTRTDESVSEAKETIERCLDVVSDQYGVQSRIVRTMLASPTTGTAGEFGYSQTVSSGSGDVSVEQHSITLVTQVEDVRIAVTGMSQRGAEVDRSALENVLAAAVAKVR